MANLPVIRSKEKIYGDLVTGLQSRRPELNDFSRGSVLSQLFQSIAQSQFKASASVIGMMDATSVDRAVGEALQRLAKDANVPIFPAIPSTGMVDITDTSFTKVSTSIYAGQPAPVAGSLTIYVTNASQFTGTNGKIYIGRGGANYEGPLDYSSVQPEAGGAYWSITLKTSSPTTLFHNIGESVILAKGGNRVIQSGTIVRTGSGLAAAAVDFSTTSQAIMLDGETTVTGIPVICNRPGVIGNVPRGAIKELVSSLFKGSAFNPNPFYTGRDADNDEQIRARIKLAEQSKARGTSAAIQYYTTNVVSPDEQKKVQSSQVVSYADNTAALVFDDGSGYEPLYSGIGYETVIDTAVGGEREVQLRSRPVAQARVISVTKAPYELENMSGIRVEVGGVVTSHQFDTSKFRVPTAATGYEIAGSINGNPNVNFLAQTANGGTNVVLYPKDRLANNIKVLPYTAGTDANTILKFPLTEDLTLRLYKNNSPLYQDGKVAALLTTAKSSWSTAILDGDTLEYTVDGAVSVTATFTTALFQSILPTATVSYLETLEVWAEAFNRAMPGVGARIVNDTIELSSNLGADNRAALSITGGSLRNKIFDVNASLIAEGVASDFTFNRWTGQIGLAAPLATGDRLTAGSPLTNAHLESIALPTGSPAAGKFWLLADGDARNIPNQLAANAQLQFAKVGPKITISAQTPSLVPTGFGLAKPGDWLLVWSNTGDPAGLIGNTGFWRIESVTTGQIVVNDGTVARPVASWFTPSSDRIVIVRSQAPMQPVEFGINSLSDLAAEIQSQLSGVFVGVTSSKLLFISKTNDSTSELFIAAADAGGKNLQLPLLTKATGLQAQSGYSQNEVDSECKIPSFTVGTLGTALSETEFTQTDYLDLGGDEHDFVEMLHNYQTSPTPAEVIDSNKGRRSFSSGFDPLTGKLTISPEQYLLNPPTTPPSGSTVQAGDRFFLRTSYQFDWRDQATVVVDGDSEVKSYRLPISRSLTVSSHSTPTTSDFSASDGESSLALSAGASFGSNFSFNDYLVWRQSRCTLTDGVYGLKAKAADFGPLGDRIRVGLEYPSSINSTALSHKATTSDIIDLSVILPVKTPRVPNWAANSCFTVSVTPTGAADTVTYTHRVGTTPAFTAAGIVPGDVMMVDENTSFLDGNDGFQAKVTAVTPTTVTVKRPIGSAVADQLAISNLVNQNGTMTVTFGSPHQIKPNDVIGLYDTSISNLSNRPLNGTYTPTIINPTTITVATPVGTPGGPSTGISHINGIVTVTVVGHQLSPGNVILASGLPLGALNGKYAVLSTPDANTLTYAVPGNLGSAAAGGRIDFQSYETGPSSSPITSISRLGGDTVNVVTSTPHGLAPGDLVTVALTDITAWSNVTTYGVGDVIKYSGFYYRSLLGLNTGNTPSSSPSYWQSTTQTFNGIWVVDTTATPNDFSYKFPATSGDMVGVAATGNASEMVVAGDLARACKGLTGPFIQFAEVGTTAQEIVDYATSSMASLLSFTITSGLPTTPVSVSTADLDIGTNYLSGSITASRAIKGSRTLELTSSINVPAGSQLTVSGMSLSDYDSSYVVLDSAPVGLSWKLTVQSSVLASATASAIEAATFTGTRKAVRMTDGSNSVLATSLGSLIGVPQFTVKKPWSEALTVGESIKLVAVTNRQLTSFWNRLITTGLSNVALIENNKYGDQLQITTNTFGARGSIEVSGGTANRSEIALVGSSGNLGISNTASEGRLGVMYVPFDLRTPITHKHWLKVENTVRGNRRLGIDPSTSLQMYADGIQIVGGAGSFQTLKSTTQDATTVLKIERQGAFNMVSVISGSSLGLGIAGVKEGDWVKMRNVPATAWSIATPYVIGNRVKYNQYVYTAIAPNTGLAPDTNPASWRLTQLSDSNQTIARVVRVFGQDTFWVESDSFVDEICWIGHTNTLAFYSPDSVMPGDVLVVGTTAFGSQNVGRYTVVDELTSNTYSFPTSTRIFTQTIPNPPLLPVLLSGESNQINVEEGTPIKLWKKVFAAGAGPTGLSAVIVDSPELVSRTGSFAGTSVTAMSKLEFNESVNFGTDAYKYYGGLIKELTRVIYGDPVASSIYPGNRAAGTAIDINPAIINRIRVDLSARIRSGVPFGEVRDKIKASVAGYVNQLGVGKPVALSRIVAAASSVPGVVAVSVSYPAYDVGNDIIPVGAEETPKVVDPTTDITVSVIGI